MGKVITIANNKGGCGKTTTAVNIAAALRLQGYDVLAIDLDGQANLTATLQVPTTNGTMYDAITNVQRIEPVRVLDKDKDNGVLDVIPSCNDLAAVEVELAAATDRVTRLSAIVDTYRDQYDVVIIDTPPAMGLLTISSLYSCDDVIVTVQPEYLAVQGLVGIANTINTISTNRTTPINWYVLFCQYEKRKGLHNLTIEQVEATGVKVFNTRIRTNVALAEAPATGTDIFRYNGHCNGAQDYRALAAEYLNVSKIKRGKRK